MPPESMLLTAAPAAPSAPQPARSAPVATSHSGGDGAAGSGADPSQSAPSPASSAHSGYSTAAPGRRANARSTGGKGTAEQKPAAGHKPATSKAAHATGQSAGHPAHPEGSFSQTLAQSLSGPGHRAGATAGSAHDHGRSSGKPGGDAPAKHGKSDPVASALALVSQAPSAASTAVVGGSAKGKPVSASSAVSSKAAAADAKALLAHASAQGLKALGPAESSAAASSATASANAAAALTGAQASVAAGTGAPARAAANPAAALSAPVGTAAWTDQLGARLTWMTHQGIESASLQLSPEHLGPLQVSISVHHGQASVWFGAAHADTRQALEQAMPQLRQMFSGQGLTLADSGVSRESPRDQAPRKGSVGTVGAIAEESSVGTAGSVQAHLGLVDAYA